MTSADEFYRLDHYADMESHICCICRKPIEIQHTPNKTNDGRDVHDYCLRTKDVPKYSIASELDADEYDAEFRK